MRDDDTVTEVLATVDLEVAVPLAMGSNVGRGVEDLLSTLEAVRHVADVRTGNVEKTPERLEVEATVELVFHFPEGLDGDPVDIARTALEGHDAVTDVTRIDVRESYAIQTY